MNRQLNGHPRTPHNESVTFFIKVPIDGASAVGTLNSGMGSYVTVTKPAGTGIYRLTFADAFQAVLWADGNVLKAAGTFDGDVYPVAFSNEATVTPLVIDFQVRKSSDGTALDPTSVTLYFMVVCRNSQVTP